MCFESVQKGQLRSVRLEKVHLPPRVDSTVAFQFLQRSKSSMFPMLRPAAGHAMIPRNRDIPSVYDRAAGFSRILESTPEYVTQVVLAEMRDLESLDAEYRSSGDYDSLPFVEEAMRATSGRLAQLEQLMPEPSVEVNGSSKGKSRNPRESSSSSSGEVYSFYQIADGSYVVLHSINMKCLMKEFSPEHVHAVEEELHHTAPPKEDSITELSGWSSENAAAGSVTYSQLPVDRHQYLPETIQGRVVDVEHAVMDDEAQKRFRFLSHLPRFCDFYICEIELSDQLSPETLDAFRVELKKRTKNRKQKEKQRQLDAAASAASPAFSHLHNLPKFSLEEEDSSMWPAPAEIANAISELSIESDDHTYNAGDDTEAAVHAAYGYGMASPPPSAFDEESSFATITRQSGYYPPLGGAVTPDHSPQLRAAPSGDSGRAFFGSPPVWGQSPPSMPVEWAAAPQSGGKKKGGGKKGVPLFSTNQRRSYR